jgi:peptide-methionine (S)-S-oxide reductase
VCCSPPFATIRRSNWQGPDIGTQYRSTIFPANPRQAEITKAYITQLGETQAFAAAIVTTIEPGRPFFPAEGAGRL